MIVIRVQGMKQV